MSITFSYYVTYEASDGHVIKENFDVNFVEDVEVSQDETARRILISGILEEGGRVIKIKRSKR